MTRREIILGLEIGQSVTFDTLQKARSAATVIPKLYGTTRKFMRSGCIITRLA